MEAEDGQRQCGHCGETLPLAAFAWRRKAKGERHNLCRPCHSQYHHEHYSANKERYIEQACTRKRALARERTAWLLRYFDSHPCADCGETDPVVLELDHRRDKEFNIGSVLPYRRWETILAEIESVTSCARTATVAERRVISDRCAHYWRAHEARPYRGAGGGNRTRLRELGRL